MTGSIGPDGLTPDRPGLLARMAGLAGAVAAHAAAGFPAAGPDARKERLAICHACPQFAAPDSCVVCGCNLTVKASWADQRCPRNLWPSPERA